MFIRVRGAGEKDPPAEFDVPVPEFEANPHLYIRVDEERPRRVVKVSARKADMSPGEEDTAPAGDEPIGEAHGN